jgi:hypothetical protein
MDSPQKHKKLIDVFDTWDKPAVDYSVSVVDSAAVRADMESASPWRVKARGCQLVAHWMVQRYRSLRLMLRPSWARMCAVLKEPGFDRGDNDV